MFLKAVVGFACALMVLASRRGRPTLQASHFDRKPLGQCPPTFPKAENFDLSRMQGFWHISYQYPKCLSPCQKFNLTLASPTSMKISSTDRVEKGLEHKLSGAIRHVDTEVPALLRWSFPMLPFSLDMAVVDTDYENYSIVVVCYSCNSSQYYGVIATRKDEIVDAYLERATRLLLPYMKFRAEPEERIVCQLDRDFPRNETEIRILDLDTYLDRLIGDGKIDFI